MTKQLLKPLRLRVLMLVALLCAGFTSAWGETKMDLLNQSFTGITSNTYSSWKGKTGISGAVYAGNSAGGQSSIQLRSNNNNSGVITTTSGGKATKVAVVWNNATANGRTLNVYGKNSAYSAATDLYGNDAGTLLGTIVYGTSTELKISGDYEYIGFRSASGAMYLTSVSIEWETGGSTPIDNPTPVSISFPQSQYSATMGTAFSAPTLTVVPAEAASETKYNSSNTAVATVDSETGDVTLVGPGTTTITASITGSETYKDAEASYELTVIDNSPHETITFSEKGYENGAIVTSVEGNNYTVTFDKGTGSNAPKYYDSGTAIRAYGGNTFTVSSISKTITRIVLTFGDGEGSNEITTDVGSYTSGTWTGEASSVKFTIEGTSGHRRISAITVYYKDAAIAVPVFTLAEGTYTGAQTVEITCATADATIMYRTDNENWTEYTEAISVASSTTIYAKAVNGTVESNVVSATYTIIDPNAPGQANNPYTVAQAISAIDDGNGTTDVFVKGIVSQVDQFNSNYSSITYWISDDGTTTNQFEVYSGKGINGANFESINDIQIGDVVVVKGNIKKFNSTYEFDYNNELVSLKRKEAPTLTFEEEAYSVVKNGELKIIATSSNSTGAITYQSSNTDVAEIEATTGVVTAKAAGTTIITATIAATEEYNTTTATVELTVTAPKHKVTFYQDGTKLSEEEFTENTPITFPDAEPIINGKSFVGWIAEPINGTIENAPTTLVTSASMGESDAEYYAVYATKVGGEGGLTTVTDELTLATTGVEAGSQTYSEWEYKEASSNANYAGQSAGDKNSIQLRSKNSNSGVISTTSGGRLKKVVVVWNDATDEGRTLNVYGSNTAYTDATELYGDDAVGSLLGTIVKGTSTELEINGDYTYVGLRSANGAMYLTSISITWEKGTPDTYSDYCTTVESEEPVVEPSVPAPITAGYYRIKNVGNGKYVNVAGRKTVTFVDNDATATAAGTVLKVESNDKGQVQVLRSQAIDLPGYADKAMKYVPEVVQLVVNKLHAEGSGAILGENGLDALMKKFDESFDYHLYTEQAEGGIRIYGKTPSMRPVVEFYNENKDNVDAKLPMLEGFINNAIEKILEKTGGRGKSILVPFSLHDVWKNMGSSLTEPKNDATKLTFLQEVLSNEQNVWDFAYQTAMIYWGKVKEHPRYDEFKGKLGDYAKYIDKIEYIRPNVKYYLATDGTNLDVLSQDNELVKNGDVALWSLEERRDFKVTFNEENVLNDKYYTTLYTDFAYDLPEDGSVKAYKVTEVNPTTGVAVKVALESVPAQTPVLLESESAGAKTLTLNTDEGTAPTDNILVGADAIINEYDINESQVVSLFEFALEVLGESTYNEYLAKYEHLMDRNSGTVNNKFFFGLTTKELGEGADEEGLISARSLAMQDNLLGFYENWDVSANHAFLLNKDYDPVKLFLKGDIDRDGDVDNDDLKALIKIILGTDTEEDNYDYDAAHVNDDEDIDIADVTALVNILNTLQTQTNN